MTVHKLAAWIIVKADKSAAAILARLVRSTPPFIDFSWGSADSQLRPHTLD
jgi:hypothetical protein